MFELNTIYTLKTPDGTISDSGIAHIIQYISLQRPSQMAHWLNKSEANAGKYALPVLPDDWHWRWIVSGRGDYVGTFPKRVSKFYYKAYGIKCPTEFLQELGNLARQHSANETVYRFDFTDEFNWHSGDFGDRNSCFWGGRSYAREMLADNNALAIRFYNSDDTGKARAWLFEHQPGQYILFNGYGFKSDSTLTIARVFSQFTGLSYRKIYLENNGTDGGVLYINSRRGYLIAPADELPENMITIDLCWDTPTQCIECGDEINEDDCYHDTDGNQYCESCFYDRWGYCDDCSEVTTRDDLYYIDSTGYDVCESCYNANYGRCENCNDRYPNDDLKSLGDELFCDDCLETCPDCESIVYPGGECGACKVQPVETD